MGRYTIFPLPNASSTKIAQRLGDINKEQMSVAIQNQTYRLDKANTFGFQVLSHNYDISLNHTALVPHGGGGDTTGAGMAVWTWIAAALVALCLVLAVVIGLTKMGREK